MSAANSNDEESKLLQNLEEAVRSARSLALRDLELILKMAVLELWNNYARPTPGQQLGKEELEPN
jgi:hypothetical protein